MSPRKNKKKPQLTGWILAFWCVFWPLALDKLGDVVVNRLPQVVEHRVTIT